MFDTLLINGCIITVNSENKVFDNGFIAFSGDKISALGSMNSLDGVIPEARQVIDMEGHAIMPGLVDGHGHGGHCIFRNYAEHIPEWDSISEEYYICYTDNRFWYDEAALAACERLKFGTTTAVSMIGSSNRADIIEPLAQNMAGASITGIRHFAGTGAPYDAIPKKARRYNKNGSYVEYHVTPEMIIHTTEESVKSLNGQFNRAKCIVAPGRMGVRPSMDPKLNLWFNKEMFRIAMENDVPLHTHAFGGDVKFLEETLPEALNPLTSLTHSTGYDDEEIDILSKKGAYVFHGPTTFSNAVGHCRVMEMLEKGVNVAVVTDGTAPDRSYDLWRDMKNVQLLQRFRLRDGGCLPCGKVLRMVTIEPAKALGIDKLVGSLEVGKKADVITVNVMQPHLAPFGKMPIQRLVYHAMGQDVDNVFIDGEQVMKNRVLTKVDEMKIIENAMISDAITLERLNRPEVVDNPKLYDIRMY